MNTSFNPSTFDKQAAASLDMIDEQAAAERVQRILHPEAVNSGGIAKVLKEAQAGPTLTPQPQTHPQAPATKLEASKSKLDLLGSFPIQKPRKPRSDKGTHKPKAPADPDEITVKMSIDLARAIAMACAETNRFEMAAYIQDEVIAQIKKRLDALQKQK